MTAQFPVTQDPAPRTPAPQAPAREAVPGSAAQAPGLHSPLATQPRETVPGPQVRPAPPDAAAPARYPWHLRLSWLLVLAGGLLGYVTTFVIMLLTGNPILLPTVLLVGAATIPVTVLLLAQSTRSGPVVPGRIVLVTVAASGLFGICAAGLEERIAGAVLGGASILLVGVIEESAKLVVPLIVLALAHRATPGGGLVIGIAAGTGFAVLETMGYGFGALLSRGGGLGALDATLVLRGVLVPAGHVAWTGAVCAALWFLVETPHKARGALALAVALLGAVVLHTAWDATGSPVLRIVVAAVSVGTLLTLVVLTHRSHARRTVTAA
ncbi:PrsW family intramembrane metalloprotease [Brachybacterium paraconglomeratum]